MRIHEDSQVFTDPQVFLSPRKTRAAHKRRTLEIGSGLDQRGSVPAADSRRARARTRRRRSRAIYGIAAVGTARRDSQACVRNRGDIRRPRCGFTDAGRRGLHQRIRRVRARLCSVCRFTMTTTTTTTTTTRMTMTRRARSRRAEAPL